MKPLTKYFSIVGLTAISTAIHADLNSEIGYTKLQAKLSLQGKSLPDGTGVQVQLVEACGKSVDDDNNPETPPVCLAWLPDQTDTQFLGKSFDDVSESTSGLFSSHATGVARLFFGNDSSIANGIDKIDTYLADHWLDSGYLQAGNPALLPSISANRIANHSWVGTADDIPDDELTNSDILRRVDWLIDTDEFLQIVGLTNGSANPALLGSAFNVIAVGRSDGGHGTGSVPIDETYQAGRTRPDLVAPLSTSSSATPVISAAAALLVETGHNDPSLSTDPQTISTSNRAGNVIYNAERSEVIKAILMTGAERKSNIISDYRSTTTVQTKNGLDSRFGAGQLNIANSYHIIAAGEQNSAEDSQNEISIIQPSGFDYDPAFGSNANNAEASYTFSTDSKPEILYVSLVWNIRIRGKQNGEFNGAAELDNLDLKLFDVTGNPALVASSNSNNENTENLWITLDRHRDYLLKVVVGPNQTAFNRDYAIAWRREKDTDLDGIADHDDNCLAVVNPDQRDSDEDGFGNRCDADLDNSGLVSFADLNLFRNRFNTADPDADFDGSGTVSFDDLVIFRSLFGRPPGPGSEL